MAVDGHLDAVAVQVLEHVDPLLGWQNSLQNQSVRPGRVASVTYLDNLDTFIVDLGVGGC